MKHEHVSHRLKELDGEQTSGDSQRLEPRPAEWLIHRVLESCNGKPDGALMAWLEKHQVYPDDIAHWRAEQSGESTVADWNDPGKVLHSVRGILEPLHPQATFLLGMLNSLVARHAPHNAGLVPLTPPGEPEPLSAEPEAAPAAPVKPNHLPDDVAALVYERAGVPNPRSTSIHAV